MANIYKHEFAKEMEIDGKKIKSLEFDFGKLTGEDLINVEAELKARGNSSGENMTPYYSSAHKIMLAAKAANVGADELARLPIWDFMEITAATAAFLIFGAYAEEAATMPRENG